MKAASANAQLPIILSTQLLGFYFTRPMSHVTHQWDAAREDSKRATVLHLFGSRPNFQRASHLAFTGALSESLYECHCIALKAHFQNSQAIWMYKEAQELALSTIIKNFHPSETDGLSKTLRRLWIKSSASEGWRLSATKLSSFFVASLEIKMASRIWQRAFSSVRWPQSWKVWYGSF